MSAFDRWFSSKIGLFEGPEYTRVTSICSISTSILSLIELFITRRGLGKCNKEQADHQQQNGERDPGSYSRDKQRHHEKDKENFPEHGHVLLLLINRIFHLFS